METTLTKPSNWLKLWAGVVGLAFERVKPAAHNGHVVPSKPAVAGKPAAAHKPVVTPKPKAAAAPPQIPPDDLTLIHGIGPTFARRLHDAGITTYAQVAAMMPHELQTMAKAADWQANPAEWIEQAKELLR